MCLYVSDCQTHKSLSRDPVHLPTLLQLPIHQNSLEDTIMIDAILVHGGVPGTIFVGLLCMGFGAILMRLGL
jgi:hypothetical protein